MKLLKHTLCAVIFISLLAACSKEDNSAVVLPQPTVAFTATPLVDNPNYIVLENQTTGEQVLSAWKFKADAGFIRDEEGLDTVYYALAGTYTVTLAANNGSGVVEVSKDIIIENDDFVPSDPDACLVLVDWESGEDEGWNEWGQAASVVDNPEPNAVNSSSKVMKLGQKAGGAFSASAVKSGAVAFNDKTLKVTIDAYFEEAGELKLQVEGDFNTGYFLPVEPGAWVTIEYDLVGEIKSGVDYPWILIQSSTEGDYYIDNVKYFATDIDPGPGGNGTVFGDFEDGEVGDWNAWGQDVKVADNPNPNTVNSSNNALLMSQTEPWANNAVREGVIVTDKATKMTIDAYFEVEGSLKFQIEADFATGYFLDVPAGEWVTLEYDLAGQVSAGGDYPWVVIQGNTSGNYYIDNITYYEE